MARDARRARGLEPARDLRLLVGVAVGARTARSEELAAVAEALHEVVLHDDLGGGVEDEVFDALNAVAQLADLLVDGADDADGADLLVDGADGAGDALALPELRGPDDDPAMWCLALAANAVGDRVLRAALLEDVGGWALGHGDPLRAWVAADGRPS